MLEEKDNVVWDFENRAINVEKTPRQAQIVEYLDSKHISSPAKFCL